MRKEFRSFLLKGNLLQLAVAFIMGAAFATMARSFVDDLIMPIIGKLVGNVDFANLFINLSDQTYESATAARAAGAPAIYYGAFLNTVIAFLIVALIMFFLIRTATRLERSAEAGPATTKACPFCKTSIPIAANRCPSCTSHLPD